MNDLNASERQMALTEVIIKDIWLFTQINMHYFNTSERQMALNEVIFKDIWPYYSKR